MSTRLIDITVDELTVLIDERLARTTPAASAVAPAVLGTIQAATYTALPARQLRDAHKTGALPAVTTDPLRFRITHLDAYLDQLTKENNQ